MSYWTECQQFYRQFREQYTTTGSILPSSRALARALTRPTRRARRPRRILEVGPGTGAVTAELVRLVGPGDRLDIVEINGAFVAHLQGRFEREPDFRRVREQCRLIHGPLQEVPGEGDYDCMISGLPLNNFSLGLVEEIYASYQRLLRPGGTLSYFEYLAVRALKMPFVAGPERERLTLLTSYLDERIRRYQVGEDIVYLNVPPAVARHLRFTG